MYVCVCFDTTGTDGVEAMPTVDDMAGYDSDGGNSALGGTAASETGRSDRSRRSKRSFRGGNVGQVLRSDATTHS